MIALLEAKRAGLLVRAQVQNNLMAGLVVGVVALPLAMAFAIASGVRPEQGVYTAIIAGLVVTLLGGSRLQIAGPTGAFVVILSAITAQYGVDGLQVATFMAGLMLIAMGAMGLGAVIRFIPDPVVVGFTGGIGVIVLVGAVPSFAGVQLPSGLMLFHEKLLAIIRLLPLVSLPTLFMGLGSLAVLVISPRIVKAIPAPLVAMVLATVVQSVFQLPGVATIGSAYGAIPQTLPSFTLPDLSLSHCLHLIGPAFAIALLGGIESLLSALVADGMAGTRHDSNQELVGQGLANVLVPFFGGFAATGAIARTATSVRHGATSPLAGIAHAATLVLVLLVCAPLASNIPLCALSAILFVVAWNMSDVPRVSRLMKTAPPADVAVLVITLLLTVFADLVMAVNAGVVLSALLFMHRMARAVRIEQHNASDLSQALQMPVQLSPGCVVMGIDGPFFFGVAERLEHALREIHEQADTVVIRLHRVPFVDATAIAALDDLARACALHGTRLVLCEAAGNVLSKMEKAGLLDRVGRHNVFATLGECLASISSPPN